jgi:hypothetical protein
MTSLRTGAAQAEGGLEIIGAARVCCRTPKGGSCAGAEGREESPTTHSEAFDARGRHCRRSARSPESHKSEAGGFAQLKSGELAGGRKISC